MTLTQLTYILAVDTYRSFRKAAEQCYVTQPTLSMQIQKLEKELGIIIFDRSTYPIEPTDLGSRVIEQIRKIIDETERLKEIIHKSKSMIFGRLRIGIIPTIAPYLLPLFVDKLINQYQGLELSIDELQTSKILQLLEQNLLDVGIVSGPINHPRIIEKVLYNEPFVGFISHDHPLIKKEKIKVEDLTLEDLWLLKEGHCFRDQILQLCKSVLTRNPLHSVRLRFEGENLETLKKLVENNVGITLLPYLATLSLKGTSSERLIREFYPPVPTRRVSLIYGKSKLKLQLIKVLQKAIVAAIPAELHKYNSKKSSNSNKKPTDGELVHFERSTKP